MSLLHQHELAGCSCPTIEIRVEGELDASAMPRLRGRLEDALSLTPTQLYVDLADCTFLSAQAVALLLDAHRQVRRDAGRLVLRGCSQRHRRVLALMGLQEVFDREDGEGIG